jgi:putative ABC transport system ATP-binding protein
MESSQDKMAVSCRGLSKTYGSGPAQVHALRGADLDVKAGELLMLVGPSGSGKTTLISILSGLLHQDDGECEVLGHDLSRMSDDQRVRFRGASIGFVFQDFNLLPALTAAENVAIPLMLAGRPRASALGAAAHMLAAVGLETRGGALPGELSGGQKQRVAIARALVHEPRLIVCDEPTSNLDHRTGCEMMAILRGLTGRSASSLIVVTHDARITKFADRIARMDDGTVTAVGGGDMAEELR